jgi:hypothetical protein
MLLYFAGAESSLNPLWTCGVRHVLLSFYAMGRRPRFTPRPDRPFHYWLDSGAFSAWRNGVHVDVGAYADFVLAHPGAFDAVANLDVIGDPTATARNQARLEALGVNPVPVFHFGTSFDVLEDLCASYPYVALGVGPFFGHTVGLATYRNPTPRLYAWYRRSFDIAIERKTRLHGFAMTTSEVVKRFPFYSIDSTSWTAGNRWGHATVLRKRGNVTQLPKLLPVAGRRVQFGLADPVLRLRNSVTVWLTFMRQVDEFQAASSIPAGYWDAPGLPADP